MENNYSPLRLQHCMWTSRSQLRFMCTRWYKYFKTTGHVTQDKSGKKKAYDPELLSYVGGYVNESPLFYIEEKFNLDLSRKVIASRTQEAVPHEIEALMAKMWCWHIYPEQLLFVDETSKNGLECVRRYAWAKRSERAVVQTPFTSGKQS
ncbi:hypothetical protein L914_19648 [Phytophthora nicotianae]|uniref:Tc1-like transposase DDE domain-containing protein n=1 Tax=Phytophthora nicotianae TaxID=4792 RepID=W2M9R8_PHYNI|nr:hypothetical protein L914_19648 [Phytophthora nicotianae]